jgi:putative transcriptional regulator
MQTPKKYFLPFFLAALIFLQALPFSLAPFRTLTGGRSDVVSVHAAGNSLSAVSLAPAGSLSRGKLLVADRRIRGSFFAQAVILLVSYGSDGAMGMVINHPTNVELSSVLPDLEGIKDRKDRVFLGGPVGLDEMFLLFRSGSKPDASVHVFGSVYMSMSRKTLEGLIAKRQGAENFRIYAGYAGWAPGQLEKEVARGDWHVMDAEAGIIFDKKSAEIWPELISRASAQWVKVLDESAYCL